MNSQTNNEIATLTAKLEAAESEARRQMQHVAATLQKLEAAEKENARLAENLQDHDNSSKLIDAWCAEHDGKIPWNKAVEITAILTKMPEAERMRLLHLDPEKSMEEALADQAAQIESLEKDAARYREPKWQPIETAPKDGRHLAVMKNGVISVIVWLDGDHPCADTEGWYEHWNFDSVEPTHRMPLPAIDAAIQGDTK